MGAFSGKKIDLIITFERKVSRYDISQHFALIRADFENENEPLFTIYPLALSERKYMIPKDSLSSEDLSIIHYPDSLNIPLIPALFNFNGCYNGYDNSHPTTHFKIFEEDDEYLVSFYKTVAANKRLIQTIKKEWTEKEFGRNIDALSRKRGEIVKVYFTPVKGSFKPGWSANARHEFYYGYCLYPDSIIEYIPGLEGETWYRFLSWIDYSGYLYNAFNKTVHAGDYSQSYKHLKNFIFDITPHAIYSEK